MLREMRDEIDDSVFPAKTLWLSGRVYLCCSPACVTVHHATSVWWNRSAEDICVVL